MRQVKFVIWGGIFIEKGPNSIISFVYLYLPVTVALGWSNMLQSEPIFCHCWTSSSILIVLRSQLTYLSKWDWRMEHNLSSTVTENNVHQNISPLCRIFSSITIWNSAINTYQGMCCESEDADTVVHNIIKQKQSSNDMPEIIKPKGMSHKRKDYLALWGNKEIHSF